MITQFARRIYRWMVLIGFLLPLMLMGPVWIYSRLANPTLTPYTDIRSLPAIVLLALMPAGVWNLVPFLVYRQLGKSRLAVPPRRGVYIVDQHLTGIIGAGLALLGATTVIHAALWLSIFASTSLPMTQLALLYMAIGFVLVVVIYAGYVVGWIAGFLLV